MKAAVYVRLSASRLGPDAPGLDRQREACERLVRERGWELLAADPPLQDADVSAWSGASRPGFDQLRSLVQDQAVGAVVVWKLDRAFRSLMDAVTFLTLCRDNDVAFITINESIDTTSPFGPVLFALFAAMAEIESTNRSARITEWHQQRAEKGMPSGGGTRPFGYADDRLTVVPSEAEAIRAATHALLDGSNLTRIIRDWNDRGIHTPTGGPWSKQSFRRMILSPRIAGLREHNDQVHEAAWPSIVTHDEHLRLRARYSEPGRPSSRRYVLAGIARCGLCGAKLVARPKADGRRCYTCASDQDGCGKIRTLAAPIEQLVARQVNDWYADHPAPQNPSSDRDSRRAQLAADEQALDELARDRYVTRSITAAEFVAAREPLVQRIADLQEALRTAERPQTWNEAMADNLEAPWELPPGTDPDPDDFAYWRRWIGEAVEAVVIGPAVKGRNFFDPSRVAITWAGA